MSVTAIKRKLGETAKCAVAEDAPPGTDMKDPNRTDRESNPLTEPLQGSGYSYFYLFEMGMPQGPEGFYICSTQGKVAL